MTTVRLSRRSLGAVGALSGTVAALAGCGVSAAPGIEVQAAGAIDDLLAMLGRHGLGGKTLEQVIDALDQDVRPRPLPLSVSVRSSEVVLSDTKGEVVAPLQSSHHYLAIAPFEVKTHECEFHDVGTCSGELRDQPVHVTITTSKGATLVDTDAVTYSNGFIGFWVPRNVKGTVRITCGSKWGQVAFSSDVKGATCLTNLQIN